VKRKINISIQLASVRIFQKPTTDMSWSFYIHANVAFNNFRMIHARVIEYFNIVIEDAKH